MFAGNIRTFSTLIPTPETRHYYGQIIPHSSKLQYFHSIHFNIILQSPSQSFKRFYNKCRHGQNTFRLRLIANPFTPLP